MPVMNGIDFVKNIRKVNKEIPIFLVSSLHPKDLDFKELEINGYFQKPLPLNEFMNFIKEY